MIWTLRFIVLIISATTVAKESSVPAIATLLQLEKEHQNIQARRSLAVTSNPNTGRTQCLPQLSSHLSTSFSLRILILHSLLVLCIPRSLRIITHILNPALRTSTSSTDLTTRWSVCGLLIWLFARLLGCAVGCCALRIGL